MGPLYADRLSDFAECYSREYSSNHLNAQPKQNLINIQIAIQTDQNSLTVSGTTRYGFKGYTGFYCDPIEETSKDISCCTFECDSQLRLKEIDPHTILITVRNGVFGSFASDEEAIIYWEGDENDNSIFLSSDKFYNYKLYAASNKTCAQID